jgi:DNA repair protein RadD
MTMQLRPYQRDSISALQSYWAGGGGNGLVVIPTGGGKSIIIATLVRELLQSYPSLRIGMVTHSKELISQNFLELMRYWPQAPAGIYSAGIGRRDTRSQILFAGIQSVWNKVDQLGAFDLLLVDEAHLISRNTDTTYGKFIARLKDETPDMRIAGFTASPFRLDSGRLDRGTDKLFDKIVYEANVIDLIEAGYLSPLISKATTTRFDLTGVGKRGGEYIAGALEIAVDKDWITRAAVNEMVQYGVDRKAWMAFCAGVSHCEHVRDEIRSHGVSCEMVTGETPNGERDRIIRDFREGRIRCLTSVGVLTTGFNVPSVDLLAMLRPTQSAGLYLQTVGRAFRTAPGKENALILDYAGNVKRHGPVDTIEVSGSKAKDADADKRVLAKECPVCATLVALNAKSCPTCSHLWPEKEGPPKHEATADAVSSIMSKGAPAWIEVDAVRYYVHRKDGSPDSMRAEYQCGMTVHKEWICFNHQGFAR